MPRFLLHHRHAPDECGIAFASFKGEPSPLRHQCTIASCLTGGHDVWWLLEADSPPAAVAQLPYFVAARTTVTPITEVQIP